MMERLKKAARDAYREHGGEDDQDGAMVRAILAALEEPTQAMRDAAYAAGGDTDFDPDGIVRAWQAMLFEAKR